MGSFLAWGFDRLLGLPPAAAPDVERRKDLRIPLPDGVITLADWYRPSGSGTTADAGRAGAHALRPPDDPGQAARLGAGPARPAGRGAERARHVRVGRRVTGRCTRNATTAWRPWPGCATSRGATAGSPPQVRATSATPSGLSARTSTSRWRRCASRSPRRTFPRTFYPDGNISLYSLLSWSSLIGTQEDGSPLSRMLGARVREQQDRGGHARSAAARRGPGRDRQAGAVLAGGHRARRARRRLLEAGQPPPAGRRS